VPLWETLLTAAKIWATKRWWEREREREEKNGGGEEDRSDSGERW
jgi:hypothetical protein